MRRTGLVLAGVALVAGFSLLFVFPLREVFRTGLLQPLIETWHVIRWYVLRLPQIVLWIGLLIVAVVFLVRSLVKGLGAGPASEEVEPPAPRSPTEFERLSWLIARARHRPFSRRRLAGELVAPCVRLVAGRERLPLAEARARFEGFGWCDEPAVARFFAYRKHYRGLSRRADFEENLEKTVSFLERYQEGNRWN
jgi:hypothetical protein